MLEDILYNDISFPAEPEYMVDRPAIDDLIKNALQKPLTTVVAGAGFGKTQAVSTLLNTTGRHVIWLQLSELDNTVERFWERIIYGFQPYSQTLSLQLKHLGFPEDLYALEKFLRLLAETLTQNPRPFTIVLDDFHLIVEPSILVFIEQIIVARIQGLSIVLVSRVKPMLNIAGMYAKGLVSLITEEELRLSPEETKAYFTGLGLNLSDQVIWEIYARTEGWVLATYLIGLSIKKGSTYTFNSASLVDIYTLIEHEIYAPASPKLQALLVRLALLEVVPRELLVDLSGPDQDTLAEIAHRSLLIRYDALFDNYHIHHLFKDFLLSRKNRLTDEQTAYVHLRAAQWYEQRGHQPEAIDHYRECGDYDKVFDIILSMDRRLPQSTVDAMIKIIHNAPEDLIRQRPIMLVVKALYLFMNNRIDSAYTTLTWLRLTFEKQTQNPEAQALLGEVYILLALISIVRQGSEFESLFTLADQLLPNGSCLVDHRLNLAEGINITGIMDPAAGELSKKRDAMFRAMPFAARVMNGCCNGAQYLNAADACYMTGDMQGAEKYAYEAIFFAEHSQQHGIKCMADFILVRLCMASGDFTKLTCLLDQLRNPPESHRTHDYMVQCDIIWGWACVKLGQLDQIPKWIRLEEETRKQIPPVMVGREYLVRSDALLAEGRYPELLALMTQTDMLYKERGILYARIQNMITRAIIHHYMGDDEASVKALNEAYTLSSPNNLTVQYIEYGHQMRTVISAAKRSQCCDIPVQWLDAIYTKSSAYAKQLSSIARNYKNAHSSPVKSGIYLSKREKEVLTCLSNGLTRTEIADNLDLSVNTVKSVLQSVYSKLGAAKSVDAIQIAIAMKLIAPPPAQK